MKKTLVSEMQAMISTNEVYDEENEEEEIVVI